MRTNSQYKKIQWLILSSLMAGALTACPGPVQEASFEITANALGSSFVDGSQVQPIEATVKNLSDFAGKPPTVSFKVNSSLLFVGIDNTKYACAPSSSVLLECNAKEGTTIDAQAQVSLKPTFDLLYQDNQTTNKSSSKTISPRPRSTASIEAVGVYLSPSQIINFNPIIVNAQSTGFDLAIGKTVSKPFILGANGTGTGEFTITSSITGTPTPPLTKVWIQDPPLPLYYEYDINLTNQNNPAWFCQIAYFGATVPDGTTIGISCELKKDPITGLLPLPIAGQYPPLKLAIKMIAGVTTATKQNCAFLYPVLGEDLTTIANNSQGAPPYVPCTPYTPIKTDLAITKTQIAPTTDPANSFYWDLPGKYQIVVANNTLPATTVNGPIIVTDLLQSFPAGTVMAFTTALTDIFLAADGWTINGNTATLGANNWSCTGAYPSITCTHPGPIAAGGTLPPLILGVKVKPVNPQTPLATVDKNCASLPADANAANNTSCVQSQNEAIVPYDLKITKTHANPTVNPIAGSIVNYALKVESLSNGSVPGPIIVTDTLPASFTSATATVTPTGAAVCTVTFPTVKCVSSNTLPVGSSFTVNIAATSSGSATGTVMNTATVSDYYAGFGDLNTTNNTSSDPVTFGKPINLNRAESMVQAANGDFIVVGSSDSATRGKQFAVRRYASDGTTVIWTDVRDFSAFDDTAFDVAIDGTGDIVVVGRTDLDPSRDSRAVIVKYDATSLTAPISDIGFPNPIFLGSNTDSNLDQFVAVAVDKSNRIITGGVDGMGTLNQDLRWVIHRFSSTGIADNTFGANGRVMTDVSNKLNYTSGNWYNNNQALRDVLVEDRSDIYRIYAAGNAPTGSQQQISVIARYTNAGVLDSTWNTSGIVETHITDGLIVTTAATQDSNITELAMQEVPNPSNPAITIQRLVATGTNCVDAFCYAGASTQIKNCVVTRYNLVDGSSDTTFGTGGIASFGKPSGNAIGGKQCNAIAVKPSTGEIAVSGSNLNGSSSIDYDYMALKLSANGALVSSYGGDNPNGYATSVIPVITPRFDASWGVTWTVAGNIMTVGYTDKDATDKDEWVVKGY